MQLKELLDNITRKKVFKSDEIYHTFLKRCLTTVDLTFIGIGATIGAGIYVLTGEVAKNTTGPAIVLSFLIAAIVSLLSGFCYAEFGSRVPKAGSAYIYCYVTLGELCGFYVGWNMLLEYVIAAASVIKGLSAYIDSLANGKLLKGTVFLLGNIDVPFLGSHLDIFAMALALFFMSILSVGVKHSTRVNNIFVVTNVLTILLVTISGIVYTDLDNWKPFTPYGFKGVLSGAATCFFAFVGFDVIGTAGEEAKNPAKSIPLSMTLTILICFSAYFGVSSVITMMVPYEKLHGSAAVTEAFKLKGPPTLSLVIGMGSMIGLSGCALIHIFPIPRIMYAFAKDGMLFNVFSQVHRDTRVPYIATIFSGFFVGIMAMILNINSLVEMLSIGTLLAYTSVDVCVLVARYRVTQENKQKGLSENDESTRLLTTASKRRWGSIFLYIVICIVILFSFVSSILLNNLSPGNTIQLVCLGLSLAVIASCCLYLSCQQQNDERLVFKTPFVPLLPIIAIFCNIYLVTSLKKETMIRLAIWFVIGTVIYFSYSIFHSVERRTVNEDGEHEDGEKL